MMDPDQFVNRPSETNKVYLGDGVYAGYDGYQVWLRTLEGAEIALEPSVAQHLIGLFRKLGWTD